MGAGGGVEGGGGGNETARERGVRVLTPTNCTCSPLVIDSIRSFLFLCFFFSCVFLDCMHWKQT